jgi:hypothetical protein
VRLGKAKVNLFAVKPVTPGPGSFDDKTSSTKALWGAYGSIPRLDLYYLGFRNRTAHFGGVPGREERHTIGARYYGASRGWHWNVEAAAQFGNFAGQRIRAWTLGTEVAALTGLPLSPDATMRFNIVSGDTHKGDDTLGTFNAMFPRQVFRRVVAGRPDQHHQPQPPSQRAHQPKSFRQPRGHGLLALHDRRRRL